MAAKLASRVSRIDSSGIRKIFDLARSLKDPINLSIGQPDFDVAPVVKQAAVAAIEAGRNSYTQTQGIPELRELVARDETSFTGRSYASDQVLITSGVSGGLFLALLALVDDGDEVIIPDPYFVMYKHLVNLFGGTPVYLDTYDTGFGIDAARLEQLITPKTKLLLLNSPANPTGRILPKDQLQGIAKVCAKHGITVIADEIYRLFAYGPMTSMAEVYDQTLVLVGHSKTFGMTGWRLGYACGPAGIVQAMTKVQQYSFVCAPSVVQYAALACPQVDHTGNLAAYRRKRDLMLSILRPTFEIGSPDGAFYLWAKAPKGMTGDQFVEKAIANNCLIIPGSVFSERNTHFRICYTVPDGKLKEGAELLCRLADGR
ncbi:MAG: aminotransferase class I/II-fold pyridoxal phosphate-dependent enzyme [Planctomycetes bacterium]|nr:aminotransferase class I/II-fold pyridoxal phosphate-dependent enzyme [Planctomycetota bacterium]